MDFEGGVLAHHFDLAMGCLSGMVLYMFPVAAVLILYARLVRVFPLWSSIFIFSLAELQ